MTKKIHNQLPITNWAWKLTKQREYEEQLKKEQQRTAQQSFHYPTHSKQPDNGPSLYLTPNTQPINPSETTSKKEK